MNFANRILGSVSFAVLVSLTGGAQADITITYPTAWDGLMKPAFEAFEKATGEKVIATVVPKELDKRINVDFAGGAATDLVVYDSYRTSEYTESNYLADLTAYTGAWGDWNHYFGSLKSVSTIGGVVRGIPVYTDVRMVWYNNEVLSKAGIETPWVPKTWADILVAAETVKKNAPDVEYPLYFPVGTKLGEA
ncbi:MAG: extracellular solute-binding protein, partial [Cohaesibacteraceae bacterium]|nr:extracellular solute-binding protein [Cohaesibacteraceae bacterium]